MQPYLPSWNGRIGIVRRGGWNIYFFGLERGGGKKGGNAHLPTHPTHIDSLQYDKSGPSRLCIQYM
jgi:hypothetical protein